MNSHFSPVSHMLMEICILSLSNYSQHVHDSPKVGVIYSNGVITTKQIICNFGEIKDKFCYIFFSYQEDWRWEIRLQLQPQDVGPRISTASPYLACASCHLLHAPQKS